MSASIPAEKLDRLRSAYIGAIDSALARHDFRTAQRLGEDWDKQSSRVVTIRELRTGRLSLRRLARRRGLTRAV